MHPGSRHVRSRGFTYVGILIAVAMIGVGLAGASELWSSAARRHKLQQLMWVGEQYRTAIAAYYETSPAGMKRYPMSLEDLLDDKRSAVTRRHLRQLYVDPFSGKVDWVLLRSGDGGIRGVKVTQKIAGGALAADLVFGYVPGQAPP